MLDLYELRRQHGGHVYDGGRRWVGPGPGHSRRDASLSVRISDDGRPLLHSFSGDPSSPALSTLVSSRRSLSGSTKPSGCASAGPAKRRSASASLPT